MHHARYNLMSRLRRGCRGVLGSVVLAMGVIGLLGTSCAMAVEAPGEHANHVEPAPHSHDHTEPEACGGTQTDAIAFALECCCDLPQSATSTTDQNPTPLKTPVLAFAVPAAPTLGAFRVIAEPQPPSRGTLHETPPPVYLATLRLRI